MNRQWKVGERAGLAVGVLSIMLASSAACADDTGTVRIGGTGMALAAMQQAGNALSALEPTVRVTVLPSLGTPGGLKALAEDAIDVAVTGRSLKADEKARGATEAGCVTTPLIFVTSHPSPNAVAKTDIPGFYRDVQATWHDGKPLKVILRSRAGSENDYLKSAIAGMDAALDAAYARPDIPVATTDQENADSASRIAGSFAVMTMLQLYGEKLNLRPVALDGVMPSAATLADKTYSLSATVCVVLPSTPKPAAARFIAYLKSDAGQALLTSLGATPLR